MSEDLQGLLEKINRDGVEKAQAEAERIVSAAKAKAAAIVKEANDEAAKARAEAEKSAAEYAKRAEETVRQSARDTVIEVRGAVTALLEGLLAKNVEKALADEATVAAISAEAVKGLCGSVEVAAPAKLAPALKAQLASKQNVKVVLDETTGAGFSVKLDGGRVEHSFTPEAVAGELARRLRPDLAALIG